MRDPYLYQDSPVLANSLNIKNAKALARAEADVTYFRLYDVDRIVHSVPFNFARLTAIHKHLLGDLYEWAGQIRTTSFEKKERVIGGHSIRYSLPENIERDCNFVLKRLSLVDWAPFGIHETADIFAKRIAALWQAHPFRKGNTCTVLTFATQYAQMHGFRMNKPVLKNYATGMRDALVKASAGEGANYSLLTGIFADAITHG